MNFGEMLRQLREKGGLTQAALAERAGLSLRTVQSWEQGQRSPVSPDFFKLVKALGASADAFAGISSGWSEAASKAARPRKDKPSEGEKKRKSRK
jgi:transcriptional regulator with XRE-family HTH domain